ncbi:hypothetical protein ABHV46_10160 [Asaia sp. BMEF1]|uniref:hypothetical protein n=1 Tax=Asaia sp. BMEF1 TaxID=3155932 RepID=UPI003F66F0CB
MTSPLDVLSEAEIFLAGQLLEDGRQFLDHSGSILYSSVTTLAPGPVYFLGLNPGGSPQNNAERTLRHSLAEIRNGRNAFCDDIWGDWPGQYERGMAPLQRRVRGIFGKLGLDTRSVPATNLVFTRSRNIRAHSGFRHAISRCKPTHERFIQAVQPRLILTHGCCDFFKEAFDVRIRDEREAHHARWKARIGTCRVNDTEIGFANLPHLSLWASNAPTEQGSQRRAVIDWVRKEFLA